MTFGKRFGVRQATVSRWEKDMDKPCGPARLLLERVLAELSADAAE